MPVWRLAPLFIAVAAALLAGCGGSVASSSSKTVVGSSGGPAVDATGEAAVGRLTLQTSDLPRGWSAGGRNGEPTGLSASIYRCAGRRAPRPTMLATSPVYTGSSGGGELLVQSGAMLYPNRGAAGEALSVLGAPRVAGCLERLLDEEVAPSLPRGVQVVSASAAALHPPTGDPGSWRGYTITLVVQGAGVSTRIRADVLDETRSRLLVGLTTLGLGEQFPRSLESSLAGRLDARLASTPS